VITAAAMARPRLVTFTIFTIVYTLFMGAEIQEKMNIVCSLLPTLIMPLTIERLARSLCCLRALPALNMFAFSVLDLHPVYPVILLFISRNLLFFANCMQSLRQNLKFHPPESMLNRLALQIIDSRSIDCSHIMVRAISCCNICMCIGVRAAFIRGIVSSKLRKGRFVTRFWWRVARAGCRGVSRLDCRSGMLGSDQIEPAQCFRRLHMHERVDALY
jgi:hypothetical protein